MQINEMSEDVAFSGGEHLVRDVGVYFDGDLAGATRRGVKGVQDLGFAGLAMGNQPAEAVGRVVEALRRGPGYARVESLETREEPPLGENGFAIRY